MPRIKGIHGNEVAAYAKVHPELSAREVGEQFGVTSSTAWYHINKARRRTASFRGKSKTSQRVNGKPVDVLTGLETLQDRVLDAAWNALTASEKAALLFGACSKQ